MDQNIQNELDIEIEHKMRLYNHLGRGAKRVETEWNGEAAQQVITDIKNNALNKLPNGNNPIHSVS